MACGVPKQTEGGGLGSGWGIKKKERLKQTWRDLCLNGAAQERALAEAWLVKSRDSGHCGTFVSPRFPAFLQERKLRMELEAK